MEIFSVVALIEAGNIKESDDVLALMQGLSVDQAEGIASWLAMATGGPVKIRHMSIAGSVEIIRTGTEDPLNDGRG